MHGWLRTNKKPFESVTSYLSDSDGESFWSVVDYIAQFVLELGEFGPMVRDKGKCFNALIFNASEPCGFVFCEVTVLVWK